MPLCGHRILVVEDETIVAFDLNCIIRKARGKVAGCATTFAQAIRLADTADLSLAILDFRLGPHTSLPVAAKLHAAGVPFIFHTACGIQEMATAWPYAPVIHKPAMPDDLVAAMVTLLSGTSEVRPPRGQTARARAFS